MPPVAVRARKRGIGRNAEPTVGSRGAHALPDTPRRGSKGSATRIQACRVRRSPTPRSSHRDAPKRCRNIRVYCRIQLGLSMPARLAWVHTSMPDAVELNLIGEVLGNSGWRRVRADVHRRRYVC